jgi:hypothetical protein
LHVCVPQLPHACVPLGVQTGDAPQGLVSVVTSAPESWVVTSALLASTPASGCEAELELDDELEPESGPASFVPPSDPDQALDDELGPDQALDKEPEFDALFDAASFARVDAPSLFLAASRAVRPVSTAAST